MKWRQLHNEEIHNFYSSHITTANMGDLDDKICGIHRGELCQTLRNTVTRLLNNVYMIQFMLTIKKQ
jgi:hypothetical protein